MSKMPINPLKAIRLSRGLTMEALSAIAGVSHTLIVRNEQGTYPDPSPTLVKFFSHHPHDTWRIREDYREWQTLQRKDNYGLLIEPPPVPPLRWGSHEMTSHPFVHWREMSGLNLTQVCKAFCLHQGVMHKFENSPHLVNSLPEPLVSALLESGYNHQTLSNLARWYDMYKSVLNNQALFLTNG